VLVEAPNSEIFRLQLRVDNEEYNALGEVASWFADQHETWACEDVARGEQRIATSTIPALRRPVTPPFS
jgi:hypothetical protein